MGYKAWRTPHDEKSVFADLNRELKFTLDAAASHANALLAKYCTEEGKFVKVEPSREIGINFAPVKLAPYHGLDLEAWTDESVFCNPPYEDILPWVEIANLRVATASALLLPPSIDTEWFDAFWPDPKEDKKNKLVVVSRVTDAYHAVVFMEAHKDGIQPYREIRFMRKRIRFLRPKHNIEVNGEMVPDENDPESVSGDSPRAGNIVVVTYGR